MYNSIKFCPICGSKIDAGQVICPVCNYDISILQLQNRNTKILSDSLQEEPANKKIQRAVSVTIRQKEEKEKFSFRMFIIVLIIVILFLLLIATIIFSVDHDKQKKLEKNASAVETVNSLQVDAQEETLQPEQDSEPEQEEDIVPDVIIDMRETQKAAQKAAQSKPIPKRNTVPQIPKVNNPVYPKFSEPPKPTFQQVQNNNTNNNFTLPLPKVIEPEQNKAIPQNSSSSIGKYGVTYSYRNGDMVVSRSNSTNPKHLNAGDVVIAFNGMPVMFLTKETFLYYVNMLGKDKSIVITVMRNGEVLNIYAKEY